jgi:hypothetical protein
MPVKCLAFAGLSRILSEADADPVAVLLGGIEQQALDIAWVGPCAHPIEQVVAARPVAAELDAEQTLSWRETDSNSRSLV